MNPQQLAVALYREIKATDEPRVFKSWHASSIAQCPKAQYLQRLGVAPQTEPTAAKVLRWRTGHLLEQEIRPALQRVYPNLLSNQRLFNQKLDLTGEYDNFDPDSKTLIEIKSVGVRAVRYKKVGEDSYNLRDDRPYLGHEVQQHAYVRLLQTEGVIVEQIIYLYITLEGLLVPYATPVKPDISLLVTERLEDLNEAWRDQEPPDCQCQDSNILWGSVLQFCPYRTKENCCEINVKETAS